MSLIADLESKKKDLASNLRGAKHLNDVVQKEIVKKDCTAIVKKCKIFSRLSKKYKKEYADKKREYRSEVKDIDARIKLIKKEERARARSVKTRKRCPNGTRKNRKTGACQRK